MGIGKKGELGAIFIDPLHQKKGYGRQAMIAVEQIYPKVRKWRLETPGKRYDLHRFYETLGYIKVGEMSDPKSGMIGFVYEKNL